jgi:hypothetical protein
MTPLAASDLTVVLVSGGIGVVGAVLGSAVTAMVTLRTENKRIEREIEREDRAARAAARLVHEDLDHARATFSAAIDEGRWLSISLPTDAWREHRYTIAGWMDFDDWQWVANAIAEVEQIRDIGPKFRKRVPPSLQEHLDTVLTAQERLRSYLSDESTGGTASR